MMRCKAMLTVREYAQLRAFVAVAEALSFSQAAERLGVTPSALSQVVRGLEERAGARLFNRTTRSVSLTAVGRALLDHAQPAMSELRAALEQARRAQARVTGLVRIHCFRRAAALFLAPKVRGFADAYPDIVLDITSDDAVVDMVAGGYDAAIRIGEVIERDLVTVRLGPDMHQVVVASPDYLARCGEPATPRGLRDHHCIRWRWEGQATPETWEFWENGRRFSIAVSGPLIVNDRDLETQAAVAGVGLACTVRERVDPLISDGRLMPVLESWAGPFPGYFLCYPQQRQMAPALKAFINYIGDLDLNQS